jgi:hypothetical protein
MGNDRDNFFTQFRNSGRTDLSRRREQESIDQRVRNGDLRPGQRSLNEPYNGN